jgi:hypothetical protein
MWGKYDTANSVNNIISKRGSSGIAYQTWVDGKDGNIAYASDNGSATFSVDISSGNWHHYVWTYDGINLSGYINGTIIGSTSTGGPASNTEDLYIGQAGDGGKLYPGEYDDFRIYDRALSDYEVQQLYLYGTQGVDRRYEVMRQ